MEYIITNYIVSNWFSGVNFSKTQYYILYIEQRRNVIYRIYIYILEIPSK